MAVNYAQLGQLVANMTQGVNPNDKYAALMSDRFQAEQIAQAQRKAEKEEKKAQRKATAKKVGMAVGGLALGAAGGALPTSVMTGSAASGAAAGGSGSIGSTLGAAGAAGAGAGGAAPAAASAGAAPAAITSAGSGAGSMAAGSIAGAGAPLVAEGAGGVAPMVGSVAAPAATSVGSSAMNAVRAAAPQFLGNMVGGGYLSGKQPISGPPPAPPQQQYVHPSQTMGVDFGEMSGREIRQTFANEPGAAVQLQQYLNQGGELTPRQVLRSGPQAQQYLQGQGYDVPTRAGQFRNIAGNALRTFGSMMAPSLMGNRSRFALGPDGNLYYQGGQ